MASSPWQSHDLTGAFFERIVDFTVATDARIWKIWLLSPDETLRRDSSMGCSHFFNVVDVIYFHAISGVATIAKLPEAAKFSP